MLVLATSAAVRADDANRECDNAQDVTVVVDFGHLGGGVNVRCAPQGADGIKNGFDALEHANISYEQSGGFLCRIAGKPESADCTSRPGSGPYWGYYYARRGEDWKYSNQGASARKPPPGSFEGWAYTDADGHASPPRYPVPAPLAQPTTTAATASPPPDGAPPPTTTRERSSRPTGAATPLTTLTTTTVAGVVASAATTTSSSIKLGAVDLSVDRGGDGTSTGFILSAVALAGLAAAAFVYLRLRGR